MIKNKAIKILKKIDILEIENKILKKRIEGLQYYDTSKIEQVNKKYIYILKMIKDYSFSWHCDCERCSYTKIKILEALE